MNTKEFFYEIATLFPQTENNMEYWDEANDLPYLRMTGIASYAFSLLESDNKTEYLKLLKYIEKIIPDCNYELYNMIGVSFVEDLIYGLGKSRKAEILETFGVQMKSMADSFKPIHEK